MATDEAPVEAIAELPLSLLSRADINERTPAAKYSHLMTIHYSASYTTQVIIIMVSYKRWFENCIMYVKYVSWQCRVYYGIPA